jgi:glycosyltransferase involved in cell wall biosynthesis
VNLLIVAVSSAKTHKGIYRHVCNIARCAADRNEVMRIILIVGEWQAKYFKDALTPLMAKLTISIAAVSDDTLVRNLWYLRTLPPLAEEFKADIVHMAFPVPIRRNSYKCPIVVSLHDLSPYDEPDDLGFPNRFFNRAVLQQCLREVDGVICVTETTLSRLKGRFPRFAHRKASVIYNTVAPDASGSHPAIDVRSPYILLTGRNDNETVLKAIKAFDCLLQTQQIDSRMSLVIVGRDGSDAAVPQSLLADVVFKDHVHFLDEASDTELHWLYKNCELLLNPELRVKDTLPVIEALVRGRRVICADIPVFREIGGDSCHYFDPHAEAELHTLANAVSSSLMAPPREVVNRARFASIEVAHQYAALYKQLIDAAEGSAI